MVAYRMTLVVVAGLFCSAMSAEPQTPVILISVDTLRADRVGAATPAIEAFAQGGTRFTSIEAQTPLTLPSHTTLLTSTYPFQNGVQENAERVPPNLETLARVLKKRGYQTAAFIGSVMLEKQLGLDQGFDFYDSPFQFEAFSPLSGEVFFVGTQRNQLAVRDRRDGYLVTHAAERWLNDRKGQPVFAFIHLFDLHAPYDVPPSFHRPAGSSDYAAQLAYVDQLIGSFRQALTRSGWWDRSLIILVSDHGEGLSDHGEDNHGSFIYESTLHVPVIVHWPSGMSPLGARVETPGGLIDVAPTVLDFLHIQAPQSFTGTSLLRGDQRPVYSESFHAHDAFGWAPLRALREGGFKYIDAPHPEFYDLQHDPGELHNLISTNAGRAQTFRSEMSKLLVRYPPPVLSHDSATSPQADALLRSNGYLSRGPRRTSTGASPDPKDRLAELRLYQKAEASMAAGRKNEAIALLSQVLAKDPDNTLARRDLAVVYAETNQLLKARDGFEKVLAVAPGDYLSHYQVGLVYDRLGQRKEAQAHMQIACELAPRSEQCRFELDKLKRPPN